MGDVVVTTCPHCGAKPDMLMGHEIRGVYDGVLFWSCLNCGERFHRWPEGTHRRELAAEAMARFESSDPASCPVAILHTEPYKACPYCTWKDTE